MPKIDLARIRSTPRSQRDSFEALAVQLFHSSCNAPPTSLFLSLRGDGGDGGVEAYYRTPAGEVWGVQAKYFFQLGSGQLAQIDSSLQVALNNHPTLSKYWIYIPFDLTGRVAGGRRGKSEAERFEAWKRDVEAAAATRGSALAITLCSATEICSQLLRLDQHGGMRSYWFDDSVLTTTQIQHCLDQAMAFAGPRYSSALDVVTSAHFGLDFFGGIRDFQTWREESLVPVLSQLRSLKGWGDKAFDILGEARSLAARQLIDDVFIACNGVTGIESADSGAAAARLALSSLFPLLSEARDLQEMEFYDKHGRDKDTPAFRQFHAEYMCAFPAGAMDAARQWETLAQLLQEALTSQELGAATTRSLLLVGPAGIGKTHALVSAALRRLHQGGMSLVVFGDDFGNTEPWEVLRSKLGFGASVARATLFECMQACAEHTKLPFVIYIDALNESPRSARWKDKLPEMLAQCQFYSGIKVCVSTRDTYRDLVVDSRFPGFAFEHVGFAGEEFEAVQAFAKFYQLDAEITPLFSPELSNPLFLHLACKTLKEEGRNSLDVTLPGFTALFESHLKHCDALVRERLQYSNPRNLVRATMMRLAETLTHNLPQERTWEACVAALLGIIGTEISPEAFIRELEHEGLVILTENEGNTWFVRLGYQRYGDVLRASSLVESVTQPSGLNMEELASRLATLSVEEEGLLAALAAVLPEKTGIEITVRELGLEPALAHRIFISALVWRSRASITYAIDDHIYAALHTPDLWQGVYEVWFRLSLVPQHRLNAANWLEPFLERSPLVDRDAFLSVAAFKSFDNNGAVRSLINAALFAKIEHWPAESRRLSALVLAWLASCADRRVRDLSSKGLTRLLANQPDLGRMLAEAFQYCDDDYILESISLAIYSACLLERERAKEFISVLDALLSPAFDTPNILIRDSVRLLGKLLSDSVGLPPEIRLKLDAFPRKAVAPNAWPTLVDANPLLQLEDLPSNMKLWGSQLGPDFWRYQVESKIRPFDLKNAGISHENIACWLMVEILQLGFPGYKECAHRHDLVLVKEFGSGRGRKTYADRLGKKYYWIALHRLIGILADNTRPKQDSFSEWTPAPDHLWSVDARKTDLTDVRDIRPNREYPDELLLNWKCDFPEHTGDIKGWVRQDDFPAHEECVIRISHNGDEWIALSLSTRNNDRKPDDDSWSQYFGVDMFYSSIFVGGAVPAFGQHSSGRDPFDSNASCYRGYLAEYPDGSVYEQLAAEGDFYRGPPKMLFTVVELLRSGEWEYDFSYSTQERQESLIVPCQDVIKVLKLQWDKQRGWIDSCGALIAFEASSKKEGGVFIRRASLNEYLEATKRKLVYRRFVNRGFFKPNGSDGSQIDLLTWMLYRSKSNPRVLDEDERPFNC